MGVGKWGGAQSRQSAKLFNSRRNRDSPTPSPAGECVPPSFGLGGGGGMGRSRKRLAVCKKEVKMDGFVVDSWYNRDKRSGNEILDGEEIPVLR